MIPLLSNQEVLSTSFFLNTGPVKGGKELFRCRRRFLPVSVLDSSPEHVIVHPFAQVCSDWICQFRITFQRAEGSVLAHQGEENAVCREGFRNKINAVHCVLFLPRKNKMADQNTALEEPVTVHHIISGLAEHLADGVFRHGWIVWRKGILLSRFLMKVFQIRQIDLHEPFEHLQGFDAFIPGTVPHYWDLELC